MNYLLMRIFKYKEKIYARYCAVLRKCINFMLLNDCCFFCPNLLYY